MSHVGVVALSLLIYQASSPPQERARARTRCTCKLRNLHRRQQDEPRPTHRSPSERGRAHAKDTRARMARHPPRQQLGEALIHGDGRDVADHHQCVRSPSMRVCSSMRVQCWHPDAVTGKPSRPAQSVHRHVFVRHRHRASMVDWFEAIATKLWSKQPGPPTGAALPVH